MNYKNIGHIFIKSMLVLSSIHIFTVYGAAAEKIMLPAFTEQLPTQETMLTTDAQQPSNDLIIFLDPQGRETKENYWKEFAVTSNFLIALQAQTAPIICTKNFIENFILLREKIGIINFLHMQKIMKTSKDLKTVFKEAQKIYREIAIPIYDEELEQQSTVPPFFSIAKKASLSIITIMGAINFDNNIWHGYVHQHGNLVLLIPQKYIDIYKQGNINTCGFNLETLIKIENMRDPDLYPFFQKKPSISFMDALESMFIHNSPVTLSDEKESKKQASWNIYMNGHGDPAKTINSQSTGIIAGLPISNFLHFMKFCQNTIKTSYLHYTTCFSGGVNRSLLNDELKKLPVNFIISSEGTDESEVFLNIKLSPSPSPENNDWFSSVRFDIFFRLLHEFFDNLPADSMEQEKKIFTSLKKDPIKAIIHSVSAHISQAPFVRFPSVGVFSAINIDEKIKILTNSLVTAHELESNPITLTNEKIEDIIIYPHRIDEALIINNPFIVLPTSAEFSTSHKEMYSFNRIHYTLKKTPTLSTSVLFDFFYHITAHNATQFKKALLIKKLYLNDALENPDQLKNLSTVNNMIILLSPGARSPNSEITGKFDVCFNSRYGHVMYGTMSIPDFNESAIAKQFNTLKLTMADSDQIQNFAQKFLDITNIEWASLTRETKPPHFFAKQKSSADILQTLADIIDESVEKTVPQPGALFEVLSKQKAAQGQKAAQLPQDKVASPATPIFSAESD